MEERDTAALPVCGVHLDGRMKPAILFFVAMLAACGSRALPPTDRLVSSEAAARSARELGAEREPQAALHLKLADEQIARARSLMKEGDNKRADLVLQRASADAELSVMIAKEATLRADADQAMKATQNAKTAPTNREK
jgi:hypothetical protein